LESADRRVITRGGRQRRGDLLAAELIHSYLRRRQLAQRRLLLRWCRGGDTGVGGSPVAGGEVGVQLRGGTPGDSGGLGRGQVEENPLLPLGPGLSDPPAA